MEGKARPQEPEAAGHITSIVRKDNEKPLFLNRFVPFVQCRITGP